MNNSTAGDIATLQNEVNTGKIGELPVLTGSLSYLPDYDRAVGKDIAANKDTSATPEAEKESTRLAEEETKKFLKELFTAGIFCHISFKGLDLFFSDSKFLSDNLK